MIVESKVAIDGFRKLLPPPIHCWPTPHLNRKQASRCPLAESLVRLFRHLYNLWQEGNHNTTLGAVRLAALVFYLRPPALQACYVLNHPAALAT